MKKSSKEVKTKEVVFNEQKSKPVVRRRESSPVKSSIHPWYYVKGRPDLTEKNISSRRERDEQKYRQSVANSQYFEKQLAESQVYHKWSDNKSLVKHRKQTNSSLKPPFDVLIETKVNPRLNKEIEKSYQKTKQKLKEFMQKFKELDQNYKELEKRQNIFVFQLKELQKIKTTAEEKTLLYQMITKRLDYKRFGREKLRKKVFQILDILNIYKILIKSIQLLNNCEGVFSEQELIHSTQVIERAIKIIEMYIDLNNNRNKEFEIMFDEESDNRWETQKIEWQTEYEIWSLLIEKLIQSFINIIKEKLEHILSQETKNLEERQQTLKQLTEFVNKIKSDSKLSIILTENVNDFLNEVIQTTER